MAYKQDEQTKYYQFTIAKKGGGTRQICAPRRKLKAVQRQIKEVLEGKYRPPKAVVGFVKDGGIKKNGERHVSQRLVLNFDLEDFFGSIHFGRICAVLQSSQFGFSPSCAKVVATLLTKDRILPQGSPASPIIANIICWRLDHKLAKFAKAHFAVYSRYADDITFSTYKQSFPDSVVHQSHNGCELTNELISLIKAEGFEINNSKTRLQSRGVSQRVTGLVVNEKVNVPRNFVRTIRAILYSAKTKGEEVACEVFQSVLGVSNFRNPSIFRQRVLGMIEHVGAIKGKTNPVYARLLEQYNEIWKLKEGKVPSRWVVLSELYTKLTNESNKNVKGTLLEQFAQKLFDVEGIKVSQPFRRKRGAEQIDGAIQIGLDTFLIECKNHKKKAGSHDADSLVDKVSSGGPRTLGIFISVAGWSKQFETVRSSSVTRNIICLGGEDISHILNRKLDMNTVLQEKVGSLQTTSNPCILVSQLLT